MAQMLWRDKKMGDGKTVCPQTDGRDKARGPAPIGARKSVSSHKKGFHGKARKNRLKPGTSRVDPGAAACRCRRRCRGTPDAMDNPGRCRPPRSVAEVLGTGRLPLAWLRLTVPNGTPLLTDGLKGGGGFTRFWAASQPRRPQSRSSWSSRS